MLVQEVTCFQSLQSSRFEARRDLGEATPRMQNVLAQGQYYCWSPNKAKLEVVGACAASLEF